MKLRNNVDLAHYKLLKVKELIPHSRNALVTLAFVSISETSFTSNYQMLTFHRWHLHSCFKIYPSKHS